MYLFLAQCEQVYLLLALAQKVILKNSYSKYKKKRRKRSSTWAYWRKVRQYLLKKRITAAGIICVLVCKHLVWVLVWPYWNAIRTNKTEQKKYAKTDTIKKKQKSSKREGSNQGLRRSESSALPLNQKTGMPRKFLEGEGSWCFIPEKKRLPYTNGNPKAGTRKKNRERNVAGSYWNPSLPGGCLLLYLLHLLLYARTYWLLYQVPTTGTA